MKNNLTILFLTIFLLTSCSGLKLKRSQNAEEFLIEKKNPLVMPPDISDLPKPSQSIDDEKEKDFKDIINTNDINDENKDENKNNNLTESILEKIE